MASTTGYRAGQRVCAARPGWIAASDSRVVQRTAVDRRRTPLVVRHAHLDGAGALTALTVGRGEGHVVDPAVARRVRRARAFGADLCRAAPDAGAVGTGA